MDFEIAELLAADCEEVLAFWQDIEGVGLNESDTPEQLTAFLRRNRGFSLVARGQGRIVGAVLCGHDGRRGYLHHLAVAKDHRNRGLGTALVQRCLSQLANIGILKCNIFVYNDNDDGSAFWRSTGWIDRRDLKIMQYLLPTHSAGELGTP